MLNYLKKFAMEIVPSVAATIIGAYIVNHYVVSKPAADAPAAAVVSTAKPKADPKAATKGEAKPATEARQGGEARPDEPTDVAGLPASGVKAKGISEKAILEKNAAAEKAIVVEKPAEKLAPVETTASLPVESRRPAQQPRERTVAKPGAPAPVQPVVAAAPAEPAATAGEERRDANDLARAAIERLRGSETARVPETAGVQEPPRPTTAAAPALGTVKPLPPPIIVAAPSENPDVRPPYVAPARADDPARPTPPAEIPTARPPLDLRAEMVAGGAPREKTSVVEDMLTATKSMFHSVLPKSSSN
jgi:hypothetical protein